MTLDYEQLCARPSVSHVVTLECVGNTVAGEYIGTARWEGCSLRSLLEEAGVRTDAVDVVFRAADEYSDSISLTRAMAGDVMVAFRMNGVALPQSHGFPARMIVPGHYGMKSVQWLTDIEAVDHDYKGYYARKGWTDEAIIKTTSRIDVPGHGSTLTGLRHKVAGLAFAGTRGISAVEVRTDEGASWTNATLEVPVSTASWVFWHYDWIVPQNGSYTLSVRATDGTGALSHPLRAGRGTRRSVRNTRNHGDRRGLTVKAKNSPTAFHHPSLDLGVGNELFDVLFQHFIEELLSVLRIEPEQFDRSHCPEHVPGSCSGHCSPPASSSCSSQRVRCGRTC